jgi:hypothetical protein
MNYSLVTSCFLLSSTYKVLHGSENNLSKSFRSTLNRSPGNKGGSVGEDRGFLIADGCLWFSLNRHMWFWRWCGFGS